MGRRRGRGSSPRSSCAGRGPSLRGSFSGAGSGWWRGNGDEPQSPTPMARLTRPPARSNAKTGVQTCSVRSLRRCRHASYTAQPTDVFINFHAANMFNIEAGQLKIPFSLENRTSENYTPFMESSLPVRTLGAPPEIATSASWSGGRLRRAWFTYERPGCSMETAPTSRTRTRTSTASGASSPTRCATIEGALPRTLQVGVSGHYGMRSARTVGYDYPRADDAGRLLLLEADVHRLEREPGAHHPERPAADCRGRALLARLHRRPHVGGGLREPRHARGARRLPDGLSGYRAIRDHDRLLVLRRDCRCGCSETGESPYAGPVTSTRHTSTSPRRCRPREAPSSSSPSSSSCT